MAFNVDFEIGEINFALQGGDESPHSISETHARGTGSPPIQHSSLIILH